MTVAVSQVPAALRAWGQWVCWRWEERDGKRTKPPYNPRNGRYASDTNPADWVSFDEAVNAQGFDGIGFVFTRYNPYAGVDLDDCRDSKTGEVADWACRIINGICSYTEVSPSATGVKIFLKGKLPPGRRRKGDIEFYDRARYFTVTGEHLSGTPTTIEERQADLEHVHRELFGNEMVPPPTARPAAAPNDLEDDALVSKARAAKNGAAFSSLWDGGLLGYPSASEGDAALCYFLAFWTGRDAQRMDRLFRRSGRLREKWDQRHFSDGRTYGQATIMDACTRVADTYTPPVRRNHQSRAVRRCVSESELLTEVLR